MLCFIDNTTDPYYNLAAEEYLLEHFTQPIFRLWRNAPSVIVGRNQNALAEINGQYIREHNIPVVRRLTGGGAVFHDLGNINYTFIGKKVEGEETSAMFRRFTAPIISALRNIGIAAELQGRNDLVIDGKKFSGNAVCIHNNRVLQHGTLLFKSSVSSLSAALNTRPEKFIGKSVQSNVSRVTNISEHLPANSQMDIEQFIEYLKEYIFSNLSEGFTIGEYTPEDIEAIRQLRENKYSKNEWNFGKSPKFQLQSKFKLPCGFFETFVDVKEGKIAQCKILGDYFFTRPTEDICKALEGTTHSYEAIKMRLSQFPIKEYFGEEILEPLAENLSS